jgi:predicted dienelactone hydrolase
MMDMSLATRSGLCVFPALLATVVTVQAQTVLPPAQPADWAAPTGPFRVVMEDAESLANHTIYRPENLGQLPAGRRLPVVAFAGPGCDANGTAFRPFFTEVASHGFFVLVSGLPEPRGGSGPNYPKTAPSDLVASIDWAVAENGRAGSPYAGRIDSDKIAVMGQSCGGAQSLSIAGDPRIDTIVLWNSTSAAQRAEGESAAAGPPGRQPVRGRRQVAARLRRHLVPDVRDAGAFPCRRSIRRCCSSCVCRWPTSSVGRRTFSTAALWRTSRDSTPLRFSGPAPICPALIRTREPFAKRTAGFSVSWAWRG